LWINAEPKNKNWMHLPPPIQQSTSSSIDTAFTPISAVGKKAPQVEYDDTWGFKDIMQPVCILATNRAAALQLTTTTIAVGIILFLLRTRRCYYFFF
jgi:hypothetical protein